MKYITLKQAEVLTGISERGLRDAVTRGRLKAQKLGGLWLTTERDVQAFREAAPKPRGRRHVAAPGGNA